MKKILIRSITGAIYVALIVAAMLCGPYALLGVFGCILVLAVIEMLKLCNNHQTLHPLTTAVDVLGGLGTFAASILHHAAGTSDSVTVAIIAAYIIIRPTIQLYLKERNAIHELAASFAAQLLVTLPLSLMNTIYFLPESGNLLLLASLVFIWVNDTGAFCVGSLIGKHRLFERISPKKSWEGFYGGLAFNILTAWIIHSFFNGPFPGISLPEWMGLAVAVTVFSTWGDLVESLIKRTAGTKDSGHILPGHGGILDRIDSLLQVVPGVMLYCYFIL